MENVRSATLGYYKSAIITKNGELYCWGENDEGELGNGTTESSNIPIKIMDNIASVSLGGTHSAAITSDGELYTWGYDGYGQNNDEIETDNTIPTKTMDNAEAVSLGWYYSAVITTNGTLYTWGENDDGQLGNGVITSSQNPIKIMENVASISLGWSHSAAITNDGTLYTWGNNGDGQLGNGTIENSQHPAKIMDNVSTVSLGFNHSAAITKDGSLYTCGDNFYGQLGDESNYDRTTPTLIFGKPADSSQGLTLSDSPVKVILGKTNSADGSYKSFESGKAQSELESINWSIEDSSIAKITKRTPVLSADGNSASGPLVEIEGLKPGNTKLIAEMFSIECAGGKQEFDLAVGPAMTLPGMAVSNQNWDTVVSKNAQKIVLDVEATLSEPNEEYLKYFGENTKVSLEETQNSLVNGGGEVSRVYSISEDGKDITITITFVTDSEVFDRLVVIESPIETKKVRVFNSNLNIGFKADRDGWILTNSHPAFGYSEDKDMSSLYQKLYPDSWEEINHTDLKEKWDGNCAGLSTLSVLNYNNQISLKGLFKNPDGSLYKYGQTGKNFYDQDQDYYTFTIKENQNVIDAIEKAQVLQDTYEFEDCRVYKGKNLRDGIIQYYLEGNKQPLYIGMDCKYVTNGEYKNFSHAIVTDTSQEIIKPTEQDPYYYIKIYDCIYPYSYSRGGRFSSDIKENPERLISQYFNNMWLKLDPENDEWQEVYRDTDGLFKTADFDIHISKSQSLDAGWGTQSLQFYDLSATDKFNLILDENPGKFTKRINTLEKSLYIASRLVIKSGKFAVKTAEKMAEITLVETDPASNLIFSVFEGGLNLLSESTGDSSAYTFDLEKHEGYNIEGDQFTLTLYGEDMSIGIESDGKNEFNVDLEEGSIVVTPEDHSKISVNIQRKIGSEYKAVSVNCSDLNSKVTLRFTSCIMSIRIDQYCHLKLSSLRQTITSPVYT